MKRRQIFCAVTILSFGLLSALCVSSSNAQDDQGESFAKQQELASLLPEDLLTLSDEELTPKLEELFNSEQGSDPLAILDSASREKKYRLDRWLLDHYTEKLSDKVYARVLNDYTGLLRFAAGALHTRAEQTQLVAQTEEAIDKALEARPDSWRIRLAAAWGVRSLPKGFLPSEDGGGQRCFVSSPRFAFERIMSGDMSFNAQEIAEQLPGFSDAESVEAAKEASLALKKEDAEIRSQLRYSFSRDRFRIMQILDKTLPQVIDEFLTDGNIKLDYFERYASALAEPIRGSQPIAGRPLSGQGVEKPNPFDTLTDLEGPLPDYDDSISPQLLIMGDVNGANYVASAEFPETRDYNIPEDFQSAANDGERYAYLKFAIGSREHVFVEEPWQALAGFAYYAQSVFGVQKTLESGLKIQQEAARQKSQFNNNYSVVQKAEEAAKTAVDALEQLPQLSDNVTINYAKVPGEITADAFQRRNLKGLTNYVGLFKKSLEFHESYSALSGLATEYQLRGQYDKAPEYWKRAKELIDDKYIAYGERARHNGNYGRISDFKSMDVTKPYREKEVGRFVDLETGESIPRVSRSFNIRYDKSFSQGNKGVLYVETKNVGEVEFSARKLDLSRELLQANAKMFADSLSSFQNIVVNNAVKSQLTFAKADPVVWTEDFSAEHNRNVVLPLDKAGAYLIEATLDGVKQTGEGKTALVFLQDKFIAYYDNLVSVCGVDDGKPAVGQTLEFYIADDREGSDTRELLATNDSGVVDEPQTAKQNVNFHTFLVSQPTDPNEGNVEVNFYESGPNTSLAQFRKAEDFRSKNVLCLATARPIYLPGESVEYDGFMFRDTLSTYTLKPDKTDLHVRRARPGEFDEVRKSEIASAPQGTPNGNAQEPTDPSEILLNKEIEYNDVGGFSGSFVIPKDWEPGAYVVEIRGRNTYLGADMLGRPNLYKTRFYIGAKVPDGDAPAQTQDQEYVVKLGTTDRTKGDETDPKDDLAALEFSKSRYTVGEEAEVTIRSSIPDLTVLVYRLGQHNLFRHYVTEEYCAVQLENGEGKYRFKIGPRERGGEILAIRAARDDAQQTIYYAVETRDRDVQLDAPSEVKSGETFKVKAKIAGADEFAGFAGQAAVAFYDAKLGGSKSRFVEYETLRYGRTCRLCRLDRASSPVYDAQTPLPGPTVRPAPKSKEPEEFAAFDDFILPKTSRPIGQNRVGANANACPRVESVPIPAQTQIPESASSESQLVSKYFDDAVNEAEFELTAPKTPGVWKVVLWGVPKNGGAFCQEAEIVVKE